MMIECLNELSAKNIQEYCLERKFAINSIADVDIPIVYHCNVNCKGCDHFAPLMGKNKWFADIQDYEKLMERFKYILHGREIRTINIMGGEPLLHPDLDKIAEITRKYFSCDIIVVTNGVHPKYKEIVEKLKPFNIEISISDYYKGKNFYKTNLSLTKQHPNFMCNNRHNELQKIKDTISPDMYEFFNACPCCQLNVNGDFYSCILPANIHIFNNYFKTNFETIKNQDYINIFEIDDIQPIIDMNNKKYTPFCSYCRQKKVIKWDISERRISEWMI